MKYTALTILSAALLSLSSCSNDDSTSAPASIGDKTYNADSGLQLFYNGSPMPSKSVSFSQNGDKAVVRAFSLFDLSELGNGQSGEIPAPGVIPGSPDLSLEVNLSPADGSWKFAGDSETGYCKFSYSGFASPEKLILNLDDVILKSGGVNPSVWAPAPIEKDSKGEYTSLPFYIHWDYTPLPDVDIDFAPLIEAIATIPVIPVYNNTAYMSLSQALTQVVQSVAFRNDGNIIISYLSTSFGAAQLAQTEPNRFQYVLASPSTVKIFIDPMSLFGLILVNTSGGTPPDKVDLTDTGLFPSGASGASDSSASGSSLIASELMNSALAYFLPRLADGIPMDFSIAGNRLDLYIDTEMATSLFNEIIVPVLKKQEAVESLLKYVESDPALSPLLPEIQKALPLFPRIFERTNTLRLEFSLTPLNS